MAECTQRAPLVPVQWEGMIVGTKHWATVYSYIHVIIREGVHKKGKFVSLIKLAVVSAKFLLSVCYQARTKRGCLKGARANLGLLMNKEDTITGPVDSIGAPKIYILGKRILGT